MPTVDWEMMPYFLAVARGGSLRSGAELLNANHGTVNRAIQALEAAYGVQLFKRSRRGFELTAAGETLLPLAEEAERVFLGARRRVEGLDRTETGTVRFSVSPMMAHDVLGPILVRFFEAHPGIQVEVRLTDMFESINRAETDVSLRVAFEIDDDVVARKLYPMAVCTYASQDYIDRAVPKAGPGGSGLTWIGWDGPDDAPSWLPQSDFPRAEVRQAVAEGFMHLSLIRRGYGMSNMPVIYEKLYPDLRRVPGGRLQLNRTLWLLLHSDMRRTVRVRRFVDFLADGLMDLRPDMQGELYRKA